MVQVHTIRCDFSLKFYAAHTEWKLQDY